MGQVLRVDLEIFGAHQEFDGSDNVTSARSHHRLEGVAFVMRKDLGHDVCGVPVPAREVLGFLRLAARLGVRGRGAAGTLRLVKGRGRARAVVSGQGGPVPVRGQVCLLG